VERMTMVIALLPRLAESSTQLFLSQQGWRRRIYSSK
jgi:hypothetical protein